MWSQLAHVAWDRPQQPFCSVCGDRTRCRAKLCKEIEGLRKQQSLLKDIVTRQREELEDLEEGNRLLSIFASDPSQSFSNAAPNARCGLAPSEQTLQQISSSPDLYKEAQQVLQGVRAWCDGVATEKGLVDASPIPKTLNDESWARRTGSVQPPRNVKELQEALAVQAAQRDAWRIERNRLETAVRDLKQRNIELSRHVVEEPHAEVDRLRAEINHLRDETTACHASWQSSEHALSVAREEAETTEMQLESAAAQLQEAKRQLTSDEDGKRLQEEQLRHSVEAMEVLQQQLREARKERAELQRSLSQSRQSVVQIRRHLGSQAPPPVIQ